MRTQTPERQCVPPVQRVPQAAQFVSVVREVSQPSAATPLQSPEPGVHVMIVHAPAAQPSELVFARAHVAPQPPQLVGSTAVFAQNEVGADPQVVSGAAHVVPHTPPEQTCPAGHDVPHPPQLALSVWVFTSQPSEGLMSQSA